MNTKTGKRSIIAVLLLCVIASSLILSGCGEKKEPVVLNISDTARTLVGEVEFDDKLTLIDSEAVKYLYGIEDDLDVTVYMGSGATAEEIAVFDAGEDGDVDAIVTLVNEHLESQIESYRNYVPDEVQRLEDAVVIKEGQYVILCVSSDSKAKSIIKNVING